MYCDNCHFCLCVHSFLLFCFVFFLIQALVVCLESKDYTQIRNTIMVLTKVCNVSSVFDSGVFSG